MLRTMHCSMLGTEYPILCCECCMIVSPGGRIICFNTPSGYRVQTVHALTSMHLIIYLCPMISWIDRCRVLPHRYVPVLRTRMYPPDTSPAALGPWHVNPRPRYPLGYYPDGITRQYSRYITISFQKSRCQRRRQGWGTSLIVLHRHGLS